MSLFDGQLALPLSRPGKRTLEPHHRAWLAAHPGRTELWLRQRLAEGFEVHHGDGNPQNDNPRNLVLIERRDHQTIHRNWASADSDMSPPDNAGPMSVTVRVQRWRNRQRALPAEQRSPRSPKLAPSPTACAQCGEGFTATRSATFCSTRCRVRAFRAKARAQSVEAA